MRNFFVALNILVVFSSCDSNVVWSETQSMEGVWNKDRDVVFTLEAPDSLQKFNIFINLRNTNEYPFNNLFLIAAIEFPHGKTITDTLEYKMAYPNGEWMGEGIGSVKENKLWFRENIRFSESGNYNIILTQAVRNNGETEGVSQLPGITDVGISIEQATQSP
ncbi:MAG: gliding motility lipoprotein GldH [Flavobacteriaceae bacterium]|nr:gliding motility lipoprotein GldH [Flavobacteriaceae bacterium]